MQRVSVSSITRWGQAGGFSFPTAFDFVCPHCACTVNFSHVDRYDDEKRAATVASSFCPGCREKIFLWTMNSRTESRPSEHYLYPPVSTYHEAEHLDAGLSDPLLRAYRSTVDAYNQGNYVATAVCCRRTLEGLFTGLLGAGIRSIRLYDAIRSAAETVQFAEPIEKLANVLRQGGNVAAHFDTEKEPDAAMAFSMVSLLEYLISYLYVLPKKIKELEKSMETDQ